MKKNLKKKKIESPIFVYFKGLKNESETTGKSYQIAMLSCFRDNCDMLGYSIVCNHLNSQDFINFQPKLFIKGPQSEDDVKK